MTWNYRVMRRAVFTHRKKHEPSAVHVDILYAIHEVYHDERGKVNGWTTEACHPHGETLTELRSDMRYMAQALKRPVLDYNTGKECRAQTTEAQEAKLPTVQAAQDGLCSKVASVRGTKVARGRARNTLRTKRASR